MGRRARCLRLRAGEHKVDMIGHQDESQDIDPEQKSDRSRVIHPRFEIFVIAEPEPVLEMIGGDQEKSHILHVLSSGFLLLETSFQIYEDFQKIS